jgi:transcriptional regulator with XRE-family HTH domain
MNDAGELVKAVAQNLKRRRLERSLSLSYVARRSGIAKATVWSLEAGLGNPTVETLWALADALGMPFAELFTHTEPSTRVVRADEGSAVPGTGEGVRLIERVSARGLVEVYEMTCAKGSRRESEPHPVGVIEHVLVTRGRLHTGACDDPVELGPGDFMRFRGDQPHLYAAPRAAATAVVLLGYPEA